MDCVNDSIDFAKFTNPTKYMENLTPHKIAVVAFIREFCMLKQSLREPGIDKTELNHVEMEPKHRKDFCILALKLIQKLNSVEQLLGTTPVSPLPTEESKPVEYSIKMGFIDRDVNFEECQWSRKQAALFTAQQANLIEINEPKAMPPKQLQKTIKQIINDIPDYADVHFLSFLNCLRVKEFCGAQVSLYNYFDRTIFTPGTSTMCNDRNKSFRYAALNRAAMHFQFGHKDMAMESVHEAMLLAQEAGDAACLAHIAAWAARAGSPTARGALLPAAARRPRPPHAPTSAAAPTAAAAAVCTQLLAQHRALNAAHPAHVFNVHLHI
ncbi:Anaphase-promoting complex subunit 5 [Eumeta japonica]|uniref:Anaphase-promoting complex subunit 5 n=1 Tax=Eumeta variegata TaxID=151549 RepID=A0A4C1ZP90_EUMVA|nr:Anaphase-promoting complex subunit 5 [Eumeta japonica]